jgi:hypothetical protein
MKSKIFCITGMIVFFLISNTVFAGKYKVKNEGAYLIDWVEDTEGTSLCGNIDAGQECKFDNEKISTIYI